MRPIRILSRLSCSSACRRCFLNLFCSCTSVWSVSGGTGRFTRQPLACLLSELQRFQSLLCLVSRRGYRNWVLDVERYGGVRGTDVELGHAQLHVVIRLVRQKGCIPPLNCRRRISLYGAVRRHTEFVQYIRTLTLMFFSSVSNSESRPAFLALSAIRCFNCSSCCSCRTWFAICTYFPLGLKRNCLPTRSFGAPSKPLSAGVTAADA